MTRVLVRLHWKRVLCGCTVSIVDAADLTRRGSYDMAVCFYQQPVPGCRTVHGCERWVFKQCSHVKHHLCYCWCGWCSRCVCSICCLITSFYCLLLWLRFSFSPFWRRHNESCKRGQKKQQRDEGDAGSVLNMPHVEKAGTDRGVPPTFLNCRWCPLHKREVWEGRERIERELWTVLQLM